ncbi:MAG: DUF1206 domain-containing protein [Actinomycetota bacterium]|nr:DUF1206 domain-containing protein [Actinomycetota bacterium]
MSGGARKASRGAERAARSSFTKRLGRLGFVAKGLLYAVVALIALEVARGERRKAQGEEGAIATLADESFGEVLLVLLAVGLAGYALWRLRIAVLGPPGESGAKAQAERLGSVALAIAYASLCLYVIRFLTGSSGGSSTEPDSVTKSLLDEPYGVALVIAIGIVLLGVAAYEAHKAVTRSFLDDLELGRMSPRERQVAIVTGAAGHAALTVISALVAVFMIKAAVEHDPKEAIGLDGALQELVTQDLGPFLLGTVAVGLLIYAGYCVIEARYRKL